jgi:hypothetical protein
VGESIVIRAVVDTHHDDAASDAENPDDLQKEHPNRPAYSCSLPFDRKSENRHAGCEEVRLK